MDDRPYATEQELAAWIDAVQAMDAMMLGDFERRISPAYQHSSLVPLQIAIVNRRAQLERARWFRIKPSYSKPAGGFLAVGPLYAGEIVDDGKAVRFVWGVIVSGRRRFRWSMSNRIRSRARREIAGSDTSVVEPLDDHAPS